MENNIPTLYILELDSFVVKSAKISTILCPFVQKTTIVYSCCFPRANGAKRRSGRKPGARVTNSALAFTYIRIMRCYIAQWHSGIKSSDQKSSDPPFSLSWTLVGHLLWSFNVMRMRVSRPRKSWKLAAS